MTPLAVSKTLTTDKLILHHARDHAYHLVSGEVSVGVIDAFEVVDVEDDQNHCLEGSPLSRRLCCRF